MHIPVHQRELIENGDPLLEGSLGRRRLRRCPRRLRRSPQAQDQFDQLFAAQTLEVRTIHSPFESAIPLHRKGVGNYLQPAKCSGTVRSRLKAAIPLLFLTRPFQKFGSFSGSRPGMFTPPSAARPCPKAQPVPSVGQRWRERYSGSRAASFLRAMRFRASSSEHLTAHNTGMAHTSSPAARARSRSA